MADTKPKRRSPTQVAKRAKVVVLPLTMVPLAVALVRYYTDQFGVDAIGDFTLDTGTGASGCCCSRSPSRRCAS